MEAQAANAANAAQATTSNSNSNSNSNSSTSIVPPLLQPGGDAALETTTLFDLLEVGVMCTPAEVRRAYLTKCTQYHPDKHTPALRQRAGEVFKRVRCAFDTLSDPVKRRLYIQTCGGVSALNLLTVRARQLETGNLAFLAAEFSREHQERVPFIRMLPGLAKEHGIAHGVLRASGVCPCHGGACEDLVLVNTDAYNATVSQWRHVHDCLVLCKTHAFLHVCSEECTGETSASSTLAHKAARVCPIFARACAQQHRAEAACSWRRECSLPTDMEHPGMGYWFNTLTGVSVWDSTGQAPPPTSATTPHTCTRESCAATGFLEIAPGVFVCKASSTLHVCSTAQCGWGECVDCSDHSKRTQHSKRSVHPARLAEVHEQQVRRSYRWVCWASGKEANSGRHEANAGDPAVLGITPVKEDTPQQRAFTAYMLGAEVAGLGPNYLRESESATTASQHAQRTVDVEAVHRKRRKMNEDDGDVEHVRLPGSMWASHPGDHHTAWEPVAATARIDARNCQAPPAPLVNPWAPARTPTPTHMETTPPGV